MDPVSIDEGIMVDMVRLKHLCSIGLSIKCGGGGGGAGAWTVLGDEGGTVGMSSMDGLAGV